MPDPRFVIVIGANGAGKSTWCRSHRRELPSNFYDADSIAQGLGSYDNPALQIEARALVDAAIDRHLERHESFGFESTYSGASRPCIAQRAHELGYSTYAIFIGTRDAAINIDRIAARVRARTGHHVPESEIRRTSMPMIRPPAVCGSASMRKISLVPAASRGHEIVLRLQGILGSGSA